MHDTARDVFLTGGTGYMGRRLVIRLLERGHRVRTLVRPGSEGKLPAGCTPVIANALDRTSYEHQVAGSDTFVQLVGVGHPSPAKAVEFRRIDLVAAREAVFAAKKADIRHFVYVSVAHPAPVMKTYIEVRMECEGMIRDSGLPATILRPRVRAWSGTSLALRPDSGLLAAREDSRHPPGCSAARPGYFGPDGGSTAVCGGEPERGCPNSGRTENPRQQ